jgi:hypothetical protein
MLGVQDRQIARKRVIDAVGREGIMKAVVSICTVLAT